MSDTVSGGELVARILHANGVSHAFGVISIHNDPILEAFERLRQIHFVPTRGEAGAVNMADGYARVSGRLGVAITSTGPGAGNACGAMTEALTAGSHVLHITGQIESTHVDRARQMNHETRDQLKMLEAVSKAAYRVHDARDIAATTVRALRTALTPPFGPTSLEIPIDLQTSQAPVPQNLIAPAAEMPRAERGSLELLIEAVQRSRRPLLWLGGGAAHCRGEVLRLMKLGMAVVTSVHGRGIVPEDSDGSLGALHNLPSSEAFFDSCDLAVIVGSKLRGNETKAHRLRLPSRRMQVDVDLAAMNRNYSSELFVLGDAKEVLTALADALQGRAHFDPEFIRDLKAAKEKAQGELRTQIGPYDALCRALRHAMPRDAIFVRDVTIHTNTWGNRLFPMYDPRSSVSALGGGIGQGLQHAIGAAFAAEGRRVVALVGDGGLAVNIGELFTAVQEKADVLIVLMNDGGYGVIRNILDHKYQRGHFYSDLYLPDMQRFAELLGMPFWRVTSVDEFSPFLEASMAARGPRLLEVDMAKVGSFAVPFAGPRMN